MHHTRSSTSSFLSLYTTVYDFAIDKDIRRCICRIPSTLGVKQTSLLYKYERTYMADILCTDADAGDDQIPHGCHKEKCTNRPAEPCPWHTIIARFSANDSSFPPKACSTASGYMFDATSRLLTTSLRVLRTLRPQQRIQSNE